MKKKDYMRLFVRYCRRNEIAFGVGSYGNLSDITIWEQDDCTDVCAPLDIKFGTKAAYDWLVSAHKKARDNA
jgi:hypothetical protein